MNQNEQGAPNAAQAGAGNPAGATCALKGQTTRQKVCADTVLQCEFAELFAAARPESAIEQCYDAIAVLLRTVDVLEGRQPLGKPEPSAPPPPPKQTPPKSSAAPETERKQMVYDDPGDETKNKWDEESIKEHEECIRKLRRDIRRRKTKSALEQIRKMVASKEGFFAAIHCEYPPIDPDYGTMRCCCPFRKGSTDAH